MIKEQLNQLKKLNEETNEKNEKLKNEVDDIVSAVSNKYNSGFMYDITLDYKKTTVIIDITPSMYKLIPNDLIKQIENGLGATDKCIQALDKNKLRLIFEFD